MDLEQLPPNKPNFLLIVLLFAGFILLILLIALATVGFDAKRLLPHHPGRTTSHLVMPQVSSHELDCLV